LQAAAESQYTTPENRRQMLQAVIGIYSQLHEYPKAIAAGESAIKSGNADASIYVTVAVDQENLGQHKEAAGTIQQLIDKEPKPEEKYLEFQWEAYNKANDQQDAGKVIDKLVTYYPKPDYWLNALQPLLKMNINDPHLQLDVYRLMNDVGVLKQARDFGEMAELTYDAGYPGETVSVLQKAFAQNIFTDQRDIMRYQHLLMTAMTKAQTDQASLASQEAKAQSSGSGDQLVEVGAAYLSYGQADKAVSLIQAGIAKGGLKNPEEADLLLGMAQLHAHDATAAHRTFDKVANSSNEGYAQLGRLWVLHSENHSAA
jgi:tetratricopeptide (TPR) repeat protein